MRANCEYWAEEKIRVVLDGLHGEQALDKGDPLEAINALIPWEIFRGQLKRRC